MKKEKKAWSKIAQRICIILVISIGLPLVTCVKMNHGYFCDDLEKCFSVTLFENHEVLLVTKMVLRAPDQESVEVKNPVLIRRVTSATTAPNRTAVCEGCAFDKGKAWIDLYSGDRLIRSVEWSPQNRIVKLFDEPDETHIVIHPLNVLGASVNGGYVELSGPLGERLHRIAKNKWGWS